LIAQELLESGEVVTIAEQDIQAVGIEPDSLPGRVTELSNKIEDELEPGCTDLAETKRREKI